MVARIKDPTLRDEYARQLAGWVGWDDVAQVVGRVRDQSKGGKQASAQGLARATSRQPPPQSRGPIRGIRRCGRSGRR